MALQKMKDLAKRMRNDFGIYCQVCHECIPREVNATVKRKEKLTFDEQLQIYKTPECYKCQEDMINYGRHYYTPDQKMEPGGVPA